MPLAPAAWWEVARFSSSSAKKTFSSGLFDPQNLKATLWKENCALVTNFIYEN
jgi:hypothetical protein